MARTRRAPEEISDEEYEQVFERVCAIDVAKEFGQVCVRTPRTDGRRVSKVFAWTRSPGTSSRWASRCWSRTSR